jgi:hypothetical protein
LKEAASEGSSADDSLRLQLQSRHVSAASVSSEPAWCSAGRLAAALVDEILRGAEPRDLPVEQPPRLRLLVNQKTARTLGVTISPVTLARADEVIERAPSFWYPQR